MSNNPLNLHPVDWFNFYGNFADIFKNQKGCHMITENEAAMYDPSEPRESDLNHPTFVLVSQTVVMVKKNNNFRLPVNSAISKFMLLCAIKFKHDKNHTMSYISHNLIGTEVPYIRVGPDYFKVIKKFNRYGGFETHLKKWKKDEITSDHPKSFTQEIPRYDDFIIFPDNKKYTKSVHGCYNLYSEFPHKPHTEPVTENDIPVTINFLKHIFGTEDFVYTDEDGSLKQDNRFNLGLTYMKVLYEFPRQALPILCLVSRGNQTGKTTFVNFIEMIFGGNFSLITPESLTKHFNSNYATKNIIAAEEMFIERQAGVEKLKYLATAKSIEASKKFVDDTNLPFFGKIILCTNKVNDFMRIDSQETRFYIRHLKEIEGQRNTKIEEQLFAEIPKLLRYLTQLPEIDFTKSRMVFVKGQLVTEDLLTVKEESRSQLYKELEILIEDWFNLNPHVEGLYATAKDIKDYWFKSNNQISAAYIRKVLKDEVEIIPQVMQKYKPFNDGDKYPFGRPGTPYFIPNKNYTPPDPEF